MGPNLQDEQDSDLGAKMPDIPKTTAARRGLRTVRQAYNKEIRAERARGLTWLAVVTFVAIWCTGILTKDNAMQP